MVHVRRLGLARPELLPMARETAAVSNEDQTLTAASAALLIGRPQSRVGECGPASIPSDAGRWQVAVQAYADRVTDG